MPLCLRPLLPGHNGGHGVLNHSSHAPSASKRRYDGGLEAYERVGGAGKEENPSAWDDVASSNTASQLPKPSPWPNMILCSLMCGRGGVWRRLTSSRSVKSRFRSRSGPQRARTPIFRLLAPASRNFSKFHEISRNFSKFLQKFRVEITCPGPWPRHLTFVAPVAQPVGPATPAVSVSRHLGW